MVVASDDTPWVTRGPRDVNHERSKNQLCCAVVIASFVTTRCSFQVLMVGSWQARDLLRSALQLLMQMRRRGLSVDRDQDSMVL